jgi:uncharacterized protein YndB with AHSA1/START domain
VRKRIDDANERGFGVPPLAVAAGPAGPFQEGTTMILQLLRKKKEFTFERTYAAPVAAVWQAWTRPELLRQWWGAENTMIPECEVDLRVGGRIYIVMEAGEGMGRYEGTRWPLEGTFTQIEEPHRLAYEARSWTEGEQDKTFIEHVNELELTEDGDKTVVNLRITIQEIGAGAKAKVAAFGMKWGYKAQLDKLEALLSS